MATNSVGTNKTKTISLPQAIWPDVDARWQELGFRTFSAYVQTLIDNDRRTGGPIVMQNIKGRIMKPNTVKKTRKQ